LTDSDTPDQLNRTERNSSADSAQEDTPEEEQKSITFAWGIVMIRTQRLLYLLDKLGKHGFFRKLGYVMLGITIVAAGFMLWLMVDDIYIIFSSSLAFRCAIGAAPAAQCHASGLVQGSQPSLTSYLLLPGLNPYIPFLYGIVGLVIAVVVHEGTHGVIARALKLPVKATGAILFLFVPIGAFVEIDEKVVLKARFRDSGRILAGGPGSNVILAVIALLLMVLLIGGLVPQNINGAYVSQIVGPSPAQNLLSTGVLSPGDTITAVNGTVIHSMANLTSFMSNTRPNETLVLQIHHKGQVENETIALSKNPNNSTIGFIGIAVVGTSELNSLSSGYARSITTSPRSALIYLVPPGLVASADQSIPFSPSLAPLYTSPVLGQAWYPITLTLFWIWFINVNLAFFNAIPLYPLDGGQALLNFLSHFGRKGVEIRAKAITTVISILMLLLIMGFVLLPRLLSLIPL
jgi:membrane-associated protease RseP (regulator of RpoE activity)